MVRVDLEFVRAVTIELVPDTGTAEFSCALLDQSLAPGSRIGLAVLWWRTWPITICHSLANHFVPLVFGLAVQETDDNHGHVVATNTAGFTVRGEAIVHHVFTNPM